MDVLKQAVAGWVRTGVATVVGAMGWQDYVKGDVEEAIVMLGIAVVVAAWSSMQKAGWFKF
ncbi:MAG: hypothetical protein ACRECF_04425 [Methyloceanibacter sp.]